MSISSKLWLVEVIRINVVGSVVGFEGNAHVSRIPFVYLFLWKKAEQYSADT